MLVYVWYSANFLWRARRRRGLAVKARRHLPAAAFISASDRYLSSLLRVRHARAAHRTGWTVWHERRLPMWTADARSLLVYRRGWRRSICGDTITYHPLPRCPPQRAYLHTALRPLTLPRVPGDLKHSAFAHARACVRRATRNLLRTRFLLPRRCGGRCDAHTHLHQMISPLFPILLLFFALHVGLVMIRRHQHCCVPFLRFSRLRHAESLRSGITFT